MQLPRGRIAEPFRRRDPGRVRRTVLILEALDRLGGDLEEPRRGLQRMLLRVAAEVLEQHIVALGRWQLDEALGPELLETGQLHPLLGGAGAQLLVDELAPAHLVAAFGELLLVAEPARQGTEDVEVVPRLADRIDGAM